MAKSNPANILLEKHMQELGLQFGKEYRFAPPRKWRFDYFLFTNRLPIWLYLNGGVAIEIEGGVYQQGRHTRGKGFEADLEKYNEAAKLGWTVFRFSTGQVLRGEAREFLAGWLTR